MVLITWKLWWFLSALGQDDSPPRRVGTARPAWSVRWMGRTGLSVGGFADSLFVQELGTRHDRFHQHTESIVVGFKPCANVFNQ